MRILHLLIITTILPIIGFCQKSIESSPTFYSINKHSNDSESSHKYYKISNTKGDFYECPSTFYSIGSAVKKVSESINTNTAKPSSISPVAIPATNIKNTNAYALIIGNEDYKSYQTGLSTEQNVDFAISDAKLFKELCIKTMGLPDENVIYLENASFVKIRQAMEQVEMICKYSKEPPTLFVYYSGHGLPDEQTKVPYLIPVDVSGSSLSYAIGLPDLYASLTKYPTQKVVVFLDACFTGEARNAGLVASRGVKIIPKKETLIGNLVVFSASSADQPSKAYAAQQHGLFTYFLSQKLIESKGDLTLGELDNYLLEKVPLKSILINKTEQVPQTNTSPDIGSDWKEWHLIK